MRGKDNVKEWKCAFVKDNIYSINEIKSIIFPIVSLYDIEKIYLFGSYAKNKATSTSDIDFYVEKYKYRKFYSLATLYSDLEDAFGKKIDIITDTSIETNKTKSDVAGLYKNILNERICIYER